jgi:hypothetical protein
LAPIGFDDEQLNVIRQLSEPIRPASVRSRFLEALVAELARLRTVNGVAGGAVNGADILRIGKELQRVFLRAGGGIGGNTGTSNGTTPNAMPSAARLRAESMFHKPGEPRPSPAADPR